MFGAAPLPDSKPRMSVGLWRPVRILCALAVISLLFILSRLPWQRKEVFEWNDLPSAISMRVQVAPRLSGGALSAFHGDKSRVTLTLTEVLQDHNVAATVQGDKSRVALAAILQNPNVVTTAQAVTVERDKPRGAVGAILQDSNVAAVVARTTRNYSRSPLPLADRFPRFMIIGFGKAGTRALYNALRLHPQLSGPKMEERFFSLKFSKGLKRYLNSFPSPPQGVFLIEKSPDYILSTVVPSRILRSAELARVDVGKLKFIVVLRDPIDRAMSEYLEWNYQRQSKHATLLPPFEEMVVKNGVIDDQQPFLNASCYAYHIKNWIRTFSKDKICYVDGDAFVTDPLTQIHNLEACMGISHHFSTSNFVYNEKRGFYCFKEKRLQCLGSSKGRKHPDIPPDVRKKLSLYFKACNVDLVGLTGASFGQYYI